MCAVFKGAAFKTVVLADLDILVETEQELGVGEVRIQCEGALDPGDGLFNRARVDVAPCVELQCVVCLESAAVGVYIGACFNADALALNGS